MFSIFVTAGKTQGVSSSEGSIDLLGLFSVPGIVLQRGTDDDGLIATCSADFESDPAIPISPDRMLIPIRINIIILFFCAIGNPAEWLILSLSIEDFCV